MRGASALDAMLAELPGARIRVQVVWEPVLRTDVVAPLDHVLGLIDDRRVEQYWDPQRTVSTEVVRAVNADPSAYGFEESLPRDFVAWDVVAVFAPGPTWDRDLPIPIYRGGPVADVIAETRTAVRDALGSPGVPPMR